MYPTTRGFFVFLPRMIGTTFDAGRCGSLSINRPYRGSREKSKHRARPNRAHR
jgi:hypothetical protein